MKKLSLLAVLVLLLATASVSFAQAAKSTTLQLGAVGGSGVTGSATITDMGSGKIKVDVTFKGYAPNSEHAGHIHSGSCEQNGPVVYPLTSVKADANGNATSSTEVAAPFSEVTNGKYYVNFHVALNPPGGGITCGNIAALAAGGQGGAPAAAPASGFGVVSSDSGLNLWLLGGLVVVLAGSVAAYSTLRRKTR